MNPIKKYFYLSIGFLCVGLAYIGFVTPGIPFSIFFSDQNHETIQSVFYLAFKILDIKKQIVEICMKSYQKTVSKLVKKSRSYFLLFLLKHEPNQLLQLP